MAVPSLDWSRHPATDLLAAHNNLDHVTLRVSDITRQRQVALVSAHPLPALETQVSAHRPAAFRYHRVPCRSYVDTLPLHAALANRNEKYVARTARNVLADITSDDDDSPYTAQSKSPVNYYK